MSEWEQVTLGDICTKITDGAHNSPRSVDHGLPMASVKDLTFFGLNIDTARRISKEDYEPLVRQGCKPEIGDVLIAKDGNSALDTVCVMREAIDVVLLSSVAILRPDQSKVIPSFLKFYFLSPETIHYLKSNFISGAAIPRVVLKDFKRAEILLPSLDEQERIVNVLSALDNKVELLQKQNETLEAMARAIFKSWFVDFDPVRAKAEGRIPEGMDHGTAALFPSTFTESPLGPIPEGWRVADLGSVIEIHDAKRIPLSGSQREKKKGPYPYHGAAGVMDYVDEFLFDNIYLLVGEDGSVINEDQTPVLQYVWGKIWVNNHAHVLSGKLVSVEHLKCFMEQINIGPYITGAVQPKLNQANLKRIPFIMPCEAVAKAFADQISVFYEKYRVNIEASRTLSELRDTLLPRLVSGKLRLTDAQALTEDAA